MRREGVGRVQTDPVRNGMFGKFTSENYGQAGSLMTAFYHSTPSDPPNPSQFLAGFFE